MTADNDKKLDWFEIAKKLKTISQAGKNFAKDHYELQRHQDIEQIAAEIIANHSNLNSEQTKYILQQDTGYPTPKVDCRGVIFKDDKILMVKEIADGGWTLPGGWCDIDMTASENVTREVFEESGYETKPVKLLALFDRDRQGHTPPYPFSIYKIFFLCDIIGGSPKTSSETSDVKFFAQNEIPLLSKARTLPHELDLFFKQHKEGKYQTHFD